MKLIFDYAKDYTCEQLKTLYRERPFYKKYKSQYLINFDNSKEVNELYTHFRSLSIHSLNEYLGNPLLIIEIEKKYNDFINYLINFKITFNQELDIRIIDN